MSGPVGSWHDLLGNFIAAAPSSDKQPIRQQDDKGRWGLYFNGNAFLDFDPTGLPAGDDPSTIFIVARGDSAGGDGTIRSILSYGGTADGAARIVGKYNAGDGVWCSLGGGVGQITGGAYFAQNSTRLICVTHSGGTNPTITIYQDGDAGRAVVVTGTPETALTAGRIGALLNGQGGWVGYVYEILVAHGVASQEVRDRLFGWGAWEYDVVGRLPGAHPYKAAAPMIAGAPTGPIPLAIAGNPVLAARIGQAYAGFEVEASGGVAPYTFALPGTWPAGLSLGTISASKRRVQGTPSGTPGDYPNLRVKVTDDDGTEKTTPAFTIAVAPALAAPTIVEGDEPELIGVAVEGQTVEVFPGAWTGNPTLTWVIRANGVNIPNTQNVAAYTISGQTGKLLTLAVSATNAVSPSPVLEISEAIGPVAAAPTGDPMIIASSAANKVSTGPTVQDACDFAHPIIIGFDAKDIDVGFFAYWLAANSEVTIYNSGGVSIERRIRKCWIKNSAGVKKPLFNGAREKIVTAGNEAFTDKLLPSAFGLSQFTKGEQYVIEGIETRPAGGGFMLNCLPRGSGFGTGKNGKCSYFMYANLIDPEPVAGDMPAQPGAVLVPQAVGGGNTATFARGTGPNMVRGTPLGAVTEAVIFLGGDSNAEGSNAANDAGGESSMPLPYARWPMVAAYNGGTNPRPVFDAARGESKISGLLNYSRTLLHMGLCNTYLDTHLSMRDATAQQQYDLKEAAWEIARDAGISRIVCSTATPLSVSTNLWRDKAGQSTGDFAAPDAAFSQVRDMLYAALDAGTIDRIIDTHLKAGDPTNQFLWISDGTPNKYTRDGIHGETPIETLLSADAAPILQNLFTASKPSWSVNPSISGTATVDQTLTGGDGTISGSTAVFRQWLLDNLYDIGAVGTTRLLTADHAGHKFRYRPTARGNGGYARKQSAETATIAAASPPAAVPTVQTAPSLSIVSAAKYTGAVYRLNVGTWLNSPSEFDIEFEANGTPIAGTAATITGTTVDWIMPTVDRGKSITGTVIARNGEGDSTQQETTAIHLWIPGDVGASLIDPFDAELGVSPSSGIASSWAATGGATASQTNNALKPQIEPTAFGGLPCLRFDGANDFLGSSRTTVAQTVRTAVLFMELLGTKQHMLYSGSAANHYGLVMSNENPSRAQVWKVGTEPMVGQSDAAIPVEQQGVLVVQCDVGGSGRTKFWWNGTAIGDVASAAVFEGAGVMRIGGITGLFGFFRLAKLFDHDAALSDANRQKYEGFFAHSFDKTAVLPIDHPYKVNPPTA